MENRGHIFQSTNDSEVILHLVACSPQKNVVDMIKHALTKIQGAFSLVLLSENCLIAARDPLGFRPLCLGKKGNTFLVASETCALDIIGAEYVRDIEPGEMVVLRKGMKPRSLYYTKSNKCAHCIFEFIYFSRPDSRIFGKNVDKIRRSLGHKLAMESPVEADIVIPVPDSSNTAALGYAHASKIPFEIGLIRNHYMGRTFISPEQADRETRVKIKFNTVKGVLKNKRVIVVEDSIVRGTTLAQLVKLIRNAGPKEVHIRVSSPPVKNPCFFGMDFPTPKELIANQMSVEKTCRFLGADSLAYLSLKGLMDCVSYKRDGFCSACFSGKYPLAIKNTDKHVFEKGKCP
jgi:amidophosphoribosyltransferase